MSGVSDVPLEPGLYLVATPIGNARDITLRALDILAVADVLVAEDTRSLRRLMDIHGIALAGRRVVAYHDHSSDKARENIVVQIAQGQSVAYASEAGTPLVADPGFRLARDVRAANLAVTAAPGACAVIAALSVSSMASDRFLFAGFLPPASGARKRLIEEMDRTQATLIYYESPKRLAKSLADFDAVLGPDRPVALARELTKRFEEVRRGTVAELRDGVAENPPKGEIVLLVERKPDTPDEVDLESLLQDALARNSLRDAVAEVVALTKLPRRTVYQKAVELSRQE